MREKPIVVDTVIFDIGRVLVEFDWEKYLENFKFGKEIKAEIGNKIFRSSFWKERDRGSHSEDEYLEMAIDSVPHLEKEVREVFTNVINIVEVYPFATEWVKSIKSQGKKVYLLSNYSKASFENDVPNFEFAKYVDGGVISYEVEYIKPELEIYKTLIEKYKINPQNAVFLDDVEENIEAAKKCGLHGILVKSHTQAVEALKGYGIKEVEIEGR